MNSILSAPYFHDEQAAYDYVESKLWPHGPVCPKCGSIGEHYKLKGASTRMGVRKCRDCRKPFRVTVNTVFESSHIPLRVWLQAVFLIASFLLRLYLTYTYSHGLTYGALATPITFLLFYYFISMAIVIGAQFNNALLEYYPPKPSKREMRKWQRYRPAPTA